MPVHLKFGTRGQPITLLQISASDSAGKLLTYSATGLSMSSSGLVAGTPTTAETATVTVTATSGLAMVSRGPTGRGVS